jgi:hypothetical protein
MISDVRYRIRLTSNDREPVTGMRVGRFAVRMCRVGERVGTSHDGIGRLLRAFGVDHIASGLGIADFSTFADALALADDLSRFSRRDPSSRDPWRAVELIGSALVPWLRACVAADRAVPYRDWQRNSALGDTTPCDLSPSH